MLLKRPGEIVTREESKKRLWPADTFVDFDQSLNTAVNKIRDALTELVARQLGQRPSDFAGLGKVGVDP
jgi:DNA-binding winged helix-turn-helix (wHTH) protein